MDLDHGRVQAKPFAEGGCRRSVIICRAAEATLPSAADMLVSLVEEVARDLVVRGQWLGGRLA